MKPPPTSSNAKCYTCKRRGRPMVCKTRCVDCKVKVRKARPPGYKMPALDQPLKDPLIPELHRRAMLGLPLFPNRRAS